MEQYLTALHDRDRLDDSNTLMTSVNDWLNRTWKETAVESSVGQLLARRSELGRLICPEDTVAITYGIDVQKHGFWYACFAWGM